MRASNLRFFYSKSKYLVAVLSKRLIWRASRTLRPKSVARIVSDLEELRISTPKELRTGGTLDWSAEDFAIKWISGIGRRRISADKWGYMPSTKPFLFLPRVPIPSAFYSSVIGPAEAQLTNTSNPVVLSSRPEYHFGDLSLSVGFHLHAHYAPEALAILERLTGKPDFVKIYVTYSQRGVAREINEVLTGIGWSSKSRAKITMVKNANIGRDLGPMSSLPEVFWEHPLIFHLHSKRSPQAPSGVGDMWFDLLVKTLVGQSSMESMTQIIRLFEGDQTLGIVFPMDPNILGWAGNYGKARSISAKRFPIPNRREVFDFPVGNMFAARTKFLSEYREDVAAHASLEEPIGPDGTELHALERLIPFYVRAKGGTVQTVHYPGCWR